MSARSTRWLRAALIVWGVWELANAMLATFLPRLGASMVGWVPKYGWNNDILAMSAQYGMGMFLLGFVYLLIATDPVRYGLFVWVAVAEQAIGIVIGYYGTFFVQTISVLQFCALVVINIIIGGIFLMLRPREGTAHAKTARSSALPEVVVASDVLVANLEEPRARPTRPRSASG